MEPRDRSSGTSLLSSSNQLYSPFRRRATFAQCVRIMWQLSMRVRGMLYQRDRDRSELKANSLVQLLIFVLVFSAQGWALDHYPFDSRYIQTTFTVEDGLSSNVVSTVLQTREGFLWVGTEEGLLRFDGRHFTAVHFSQRALGAVSVITLAEGPDGGLWVGGTEGLAELPKERV